MCEEIDRLSPRARQVLEKLGEGLTNKAVAVALELEPHRVKDLMEEILQTLGVPSRTAAAVVYERCPHRPRTPAELDR